MHRWNCKNVYDGRAYAFEAVGNYESIKYLGSSNFHSYISRGQYSLRACSSIHTRNSKNAKFVRESICVWGSGQISLQHISWLFVLSYTLFETRISYSLRLCSIHRWNCKSAYDGRAFAFEAVGNYHFIIFLGSSILHTHFSRGEYSLWLCNSIHRGNSKNAKVRRESIWVEAADNCNFFTSLGSSISHRCNSRAEYNILCGCLASVDGILRMPRWESICVWKISNFFPLHYIAAITPVPLIKLPRRNATLLTRSSHKECFRVFWKAECPSPSNDRVQEFNYWESNFRFWAMKYTSIHDFTLLFYIASTIVFCS